MKMINKLVTKAVNKIGNISAEQQMKTGSIILIIKPTAALLAVIITWYQYDFTMAIILLLVMLAV